MKFCGSKQLMTMYLNIITSIILVLGSINPVLAGDKGTVVVARLRDVSAIYPV
ncbi:MAG: hypothetical protein GY866_15110 [Proteobacteria bacterium]|nr:hypothetical protein [Pseudomonadota bacterium]